VLPVFLSVSIPWGAVRDVLCLGYVCRPPIVLYGCAVCIALGCYCSPGQVVGTVGPLAPISSRVGVRPASIRPRYGWCSGVDIVSWFFVFGCGVSDVFVWCGCGVL
jgi:hypothetical protein